MSAGLGQQIEGRLAHSVVTNWGESPWRVNRHSNKGHKAIKHRRERRRAKVDPEVFPDYRRYHAWQW